MKTVFFYIIMVERQAVNPGTGSGSQHQTTQVGGLRDYNHKG